MNRLKAIIMLIILLMLSACQSDQSIESRSNKIHTAIRNIHNFGAIAESEQHIYYPIYVNQKSYLYQADFYGKNPTEICALNYDDLNAVNNTIFYIDHDENNNIFKMDVDTKSRERLYAFEAAGLIVFNDKLFFYGVAEEGPHTLYSMKSDGTELYKLYEDYAYKIYPYEEHLYFIFDRCLFKIDFKGEGLSKIIDTTDIMDFVIIDDVIYYLDESTFNKIDITGANKEKIQETHSMIPYTLCVNNNAIFYGGVVPTPITAGPLKVFSYSIKTGESKIITSIEDVSSLIMYTCGEQLLYFNGWNVYSIKLDGSKKQIFGQP